MSSSPGGPQGDLGRLTNKAFEELEAALKADEEQETSTALQLFESAMATFQQVMELEQVPRRRQLIQSKVEEYSIRMAQLREILAKQRFEVAIGIDEQGRPQEALGPYMEALEHYLEALSLYKARGPSCAGTATQLKKRVGDIMDYVEDLKAGGGGRNSTTTTTGSTSTSVELDLPMAPTAPILTDITSTRPARSPSSAGGGGAAAASSGSTPGAVTPPRPPPTVTPSPPRARRPSLSPAEIDVLKRSSVINGRTFMPWLEGEEHKEKFVMEGDRPYTDPDGLLPLSPKQAKKLGGWKRPVDFMTGGPRMINAISPYTIEQELVTDCSFVASLCICAAFERRFRKSLIPRIIYPQDRAGQPVYNPGGKYMVKLWANGVARKVVVDDLFPVDRQNQLLCSCSKDRRELWVSVVEKAYMKLNGGYDFPGSNSGIDLFALTGWIPEQIHFEEDDPKASRAARTAGSGGPLLDHRQPAERAWERLLSASQYGDCLITVATSAMDEDEAEALGLVPSHAYAVLDVREVLGVRLLLVKNPWAHKRWKGSYAATDIGRWTPEMRAAVKYDPDKARTTDDGIFWIDWASIRRYFNTIFLNWNPSLFSYRSITHATWPLTQGPRNDSYNLGSNPQYSLCIERGGGAATSAGSRSKPTVWLLLSRHVLTKEAALQAGDFLTLHVYKAGGKRVYYPGDDAYVRGLYSNNPHNLVRFDVEEGDPGQYTIVLSQYDKTRDVSYTLNAYCTAPFRFAEAPPTPEKVAELKGTWDALTAGGRLGQSTFMHNPQFSLAVNRRCVLHLELLAPKEFFVGISVIAGPKGGRRVDSIAQGEEVVSSGAFRQGFCLAESEAMEPGLYTVIVNTYEPNLLGNFVLNVHSTAPPQHVRAIPPEGEGMARQVIPGMWSAADGTAAGCITSYLFNPVYLLTCAVRSKLLLRLVCPENEAINVTCYRTLDPTVTGSTVYPGLPQNSGPRSEHAIATSNKGIFTVCRCGVATPAFDVEPGNYYIIVSTYDPRPATYSLVVYAFPKPVIVHRFGAV